MQDLITIPGVGKTIKQDFINMGYTNVESLKNQDPEKLYEKHCHQKGCIVDRCMLYVFRCAVYYASHDQKDKEKCNWWYWKDHDNVFDKTR